MSNDNNVNPDSESSAVKKEPEPSSDSMKIIYDMVKAEYEEESKRVHAFEPRTGVMFSLSGALAALLVNNFTVPPKGTNTLFSGLIVAMELLTLASLITAAYFFFKVLTVQVFNRINPHSYANGDCYRLSTHQIYGSMINTYLQAINLTSGINEKRAYAFKLGMHSLGLSIIILVIAGILIVVMKNI